MIKLFRPDFEHRNVPMLCIKMGKYSIPYEYFLTLQRLDTTGSFNFYYYENIFRDFLLAKRIIEKDTTDDYGIDFYKFKNFGKFDKICKMINNMFELNAQELQIDYRNHNIESITG